MTGRELVHDLDADHLNLEGGIKEPVFVVETVTGL